MTRPVTLVLKITHVYHSVRALVPDPRPVVLPPQGLERNELSLKQKLPQFSVCAIEEEELRLQQRKRQLELQINLAKAEAEEKAYAEPDESETGPDHSPRSSQPKTESEPS